MRNILLILGIVFIFTVEFLQVFFLMPFAASQQFQAIEWAHFFNSNIVWLRILALLLLVYPAVHIIRYGQIWKKVALSTAGIIYTCTFFYLNYYVVSAMMYQQPQTKKFAIKSGNKIRNDKLVIGIALNGQAKAYPIQLVGYHHFISDTVGNIPVIVTYCTLCRSGRIYNSNIEGAPNKFKLVGVNRFNAVLEDTRTKTWWQQATGTAIAGTMKGKSLEELPSRQVTLSSWLSKYPDSEIMQPDTVFSKQYEMLADFDNSSFKARALQMDSALYRAKSLVIGVVINNNAKAYDWDQLKYIRVIQDSMPDIPLLLTVEKDNASFHVWNRKVNGQVLQFEKTSDQGELKDLNTSSTWNLQGTCIKGKLTGTQLEEMQSYQETRASWDEFHPEKEAVQDTGF